MASRVMQERYLQRRHKTIALQPSKRWANTLNKDGSSLKVCIHCKRRLLNQARSNAGIARPLKSLRQNHYWIKTRIQAKTKCAKRSREYCVAAPAISNLCKPF